MEVLPRSPSADSVSCRFTISELTAVSSEGPIKRSDTLDSSLSESNPLFRAFSRVSSDTSLRNGQLGIDLGFLDDQSCVKVSLQQRLSSGYGSEPDSDSCVSFSCEPVSLLPVRPPGLPASPRTRQPSVGLEFSSLPEGPPESECSSDISEVSLSEHFSNEAVFSPRAKREILDSVALELEDPDRPTGQLMYRGASLDSYNPKPASPRAESFLCPAVSSALLGLRQGWSNLLGAFRV